LLTIIEFPVFLSILEYSQCMGWNRHSLAKLPSMSRPLRIVTGPHETLLALREALSSTGPAVLPLPVERAENVELTVPRRTAIVVETSGTTQNPKRVALSADAVLASAAASASALGGEGQWLLAVPSHYIAGINVLVRSIASGWDPVVLDSVEDRSSAGLPPSLAPVGFSAAGFVTAAATLEAPLRFTSLVPAQLARLLEDQEAIVALQRFSAVLVGGQSMPATLATAAAEHGIRVVRSYGSSETSGGCVYDGAPIGQTEVRIRDGQIEVTGPVLAEGYLRDPERTADAFFVEHGTRWYRTGDGGRLESGVLTVTGRLDDVIISGGIKISLGDVEAVVRELPGFDDAVVVGMPSEKWGEVAVVVACAPHSAAVESAALIRTLVTARLGREAAPARIEYLAAIPLLRSGKPDRRAIRAAVNH
jgi:O-succinylbenzoic acid--CoA ligase